jgi:hypothetical protein
MPSSLRAVEQRLELEANFGTVPVLSNLIVYFLALSIQCFSLYIRDSGHIVTFTLLLQFKVLKFTIVLTTDTPYRVSCSAPINDQPSALNNIGVAFTMKLRLTAFSIRRSK